MRHCQDSARGSRHGTTVDKSVLRSRQTFISKCQTRQIDLHHNATSLAQVLVGPLVWASAYVGFLINDIQKKKRNRY